MTKTKLCWLLALIVGIGFGAQIASADSVEIPALKDNTLIEKNDGSLSNGEGQYFFAGRTAQGDGDNLRRGVIAFDVATNVPAMATIDSVTLTLNMSRTIVGNVPVSLHRLLADWGKGTSDADGQEGAGASAEPGDATWLHTFYDNAFWASPGGDFVGTASDTLSVGGGTGSYTWGSTGQMVADVQQWLDTPLTNYGWLLMGEEGGTEETAKRFDTREHPNPMVQPTLRVDFTLATLACDFSGNDICDEVDLDLMHAIGPIAPGVPATGNEQFDLDDNGTINLLDRDQWLEDAATENGLGSPYKLGDANIDGFVDGEDFAAWRSARFTSNLFWSDGNFNGDAVIDGQDLLQWNANKFTSLDGVSAVPEPTAGLIAAWAMLTIGLANIRPASRHRRGGVNRAETAAGAERIRRD